MAINWYQLRQDAGEDPFTIGRSKSANQILSDAAKWEEENDKKRKKQLAQQQAQQQEKRRQDSFGRKSASFVNAANDAMSQYVAGGVARLGAGIIDVGAEAGSRIIGKDYKFGSATDEINRQLEAIKQMMPSNGDTSSEAQWGRALGNAEGISADVATTLLGGGGARAAVAGSKVLQGGQIAKTGLRLSPEYAKVLGKYLPNVAGSIAGTAAQSAQDVAQGREDSLAQNAVIGTAADLAFPLAGKVLDKVKSFIPDAPKLSKVISDFRAPSNAEGKSAQVVEGIKNTAGKEDGPRIKIATSASSQPKSSLVSSIKNKSSLVYKKAIDRNAPLKSLTKSYESLTGKAISADADPYQLMKLKAGTEGQVDQYLQTHATWMKNIPQEVKNDGDAYGYAKQYLAQAKTGKRTPAQLRAARNTIKDMKAKYGDNIGALDEYREKVRQSFDPMLDVLVDNGMITANQAAVLKADTNYFAKMEVLQNAIEDTGGKNSISSPTITSLKGLIGQYDDSSLTPSSEALVLQASRLYHNVANNRVIRSLSDMAQSSKDGVVMAVKQNDPVANGYTRMFYVKDGKKVAVDVPKELADVLNYSGADEFDAVTKAVGGVTGMFRSAVTTYNPLFTFVRNPTRDFKSFAVNSRNVPVKRAIDQYGMGVIDALFNRPAFRQMIEAGGGQAGFFSGEGKMVGNRLTRTAERYTKNPSIVSRSRIKNVKDFYNHVAAAIEAAPRVAEFKGGLKAGKSATQAAIDAREVTVDFSQGGDAMKVVNQWVPFINARTQGLRRTVEAFKENPKRALTVWAATTAVPIAATAYWNNKHFKEEYQSIDDYEKENNFVIVLGKGRDENGRLTQVVKIPKADIDKILGNPFETMIDQIANNDIDSLGDALKKSAVSVASDASPVGFARDGKFSLSQLMSSAPPPVRVPLEAAANYNFFKEAPIVPDSLSYKNPQDQVRPNTPWLARAVGSVTNQSPLQVENAIQGLLGSAAFDATDPVRAASRTVGAQLSASSNQVANDFYDVRNTQMDARKRAMDDRRVALKNGDFNRAARISEDFNEKAKKALQPVVDQYKDSSLWDDSYDDLIDSLMISSDYKVLRTSAKKYNKEKD